jgi:hypothetical protein
LYGELHVAIKETKSKHMKWYLAKLVYRILCGDGNHTPQFDEQLRLINAEDKLHAFQKARLFGHREQDNFLNAADKPVHWKFIDVSEIHELNNLNDGVEIYSRISEEENADIHTKIILLRAAHLQENFMHETIGLN